MAIVQKELFNPEENSKPKPSVPNLLTMKDAEQIYWAALEAGIPKKTIDRDFIRCRPGERNEGFELSRDLTFSEFLFGHREIYQQIINHMSHGLSYTEASEKYNQEIDEYTKESQRRMKELIQKKRN